jgi:hypothetical protein
MRGCYNVSGATAPARAALNHKPATIADSNNCTQRRDRDRFIDFLNHTHGSLLFMVFARDLFALFLPSLVRDEKEEREGQRQVRQTHNRVPVCLFVPRKCGTPGAT